MPEVRGLELKIKSETTGLRNISKEATKAGDAVTKSGGRFTSTFALMNKEILSTSTAIKGLAIGFTAAVAAGGALTALILDAAKAAAEYGDQIDQARIRTGLSAENISFLTAVARENSASLEDVAIAGKFLNQFLAEFNKGGKDAVNTFRQLGISADDISKLGGDINRVLPLVIERLAGVENQSQKVALAIAIFGRSGDALLPTIQAIAEGGDELRESFEKAGIIIDNETAAAAARLADAFKRVQDSTEGIRLEIGNQLLPVLAPLLERLADWISSNKELIGQNMKSLIEGIELAVKNLGTALGNMKPDIEGVSSEFNTLAVAMVYVNESLILMQKAFVGLRGLEALGEFARGNVEGAQRILKQNEEIIASIKSQERNLEQFIAQQRGTIVAAKESGGAISSMGVAVDKADEILKRFNKTGGGTPPILGAAADKAKEAKSEIDNLNESVIKENEQLIEQIRLLGLEGEKRIEVEAAILKEKGVKSELVEINKALKLTQLELNEKLEEFKKLIDNFPIVEFVKNLSDTETLLSKIESIKFVSTGFGISIPFIELKEGAEEAVDDVKEKLDSLPDFVGSVAAEINTIFADLIFRVLRGNFDDMKDFWKAALNSMLQTFAQFVATIISNPIRIGLEAILGGSGGGGQGGGKSEGGGFDFGKILGGIGAFFGKGFTALKSVFSGAAFAGSFTSIISTIGSALSFVGAIAAAVFTIVTAVLGFLKKTPRLDIDFDSVKTELGRRAAFVSEILDEDFFVNEIAQISVKRGAGLGIGGDTAIKEAIQKVLEGTIEAVQGIIFKLPADIAKQLNAALLSTQVDIETVVGGERLLEFDAKGKEIKKKFEAFINGELSAKFLFAIRDFFVGAFESLGVLPDKAQEFIDTEFEKFKNAGSREARAKIGQELLADFNAFVDAFNIVSGNVNDAIGQTIQNIDALSADLGFEAVPSIGELRAELGKLLENAELDPETVQKYADLRNAIVQAIADIGSAINGLIGKIDALNQTIVNFGGGAAIDLGPFLDQAVTELTDFFVANVGDLSLSEQEQFLDQITSFANMQLQAEQAAFQAQQAAAQAAAERQKAAVQARIDSLNKEKDKINEVFNTRIDALNEELRIAEDFQRLAESIKDTIDNIVFSPESVLTGIEQVNLLQSRITDLQSQLATAATPELQLKLGEELRDAFQTLFQSAGEAFGVNSPEFVAIFDQVTGGLENLADMTAIRGRSAEEISAEIERLTSENQKILEGIDSKIGAAQNQIASISQATANNTFKMSAQLEQTFEFLRSEYVRILEERFDQLGELTDSGFASDLDALNAIADAAKTQVDQTIQQTGLLTQIRDLLDKVQGFAGGSGGVRDFGGGTLVTLHGKEAVIPESNLRSIGKPHAVLPGAFMNYITQGGESRIVHDVNVNLGGEISVRGDISEGNLKTFANQLAARYAEETTERIADAIHPGERNPRRAVQKAGGRR